MLVLFPNFTNDVKWVYVNDYISFYSVLTLVCLVQQVFGSSGGQ